MTPYKLLFKKGLATIALLMAAGAGSACSSTAIIGGDTGTGMIVRVFRGPIQPVAMEGEDNSAPVSGAVIVVEALNSGGRETLRTGSDGRVSANFRPGPYLITVTECPGALTLPEPEEAVVIAGGFALVRLDCDTGIR